MDPPKLPASRLRRDGDSAHPSEGGPSTPSSSSPSNMHAAGPSNRNASNAHLPLPQLPSGAATDVTDADAAPKPPVKPVNMATGSKRSIVVNACQRGNPVLKAIQGVGWEYGDIVPDYQVGANTCVLFLSLKYHRLHPEYLHNRIERLRGMYLLRILLLMCDINEHQEPIREITKVCLINEMTVMTAWSTEEAATYLATYKAFEHKPPDLLKERVHKDYASRLQGVLTSVRGINKTDVMTLSTNFGSFKNLTRATPEQLSLCPGLGDVKVRRLYDAFNTPFKVSAGGPTPRKITSKSKLKGKGKDDGTDGGRAGSALPQGQLTFKESIERSRSATPAVIDLEAEEAQPPVRPAVESPDWPDEPDDEAGDQGQEKRVWHDPLESDDEGEEEVFTSKKRKLLDGTVA